MLLFSVCMLGLVAYSVFLIANGQRSPIPMRDLALAPWVGLAVLFSSCYILGGKYVWLFYTSVSLLLLCIGGSLALIVAGLAELDWLGNGDDLNMGLGVGSYCLFLLAGVWLKRQEFWEDVSPGNNGMSKLNTKPLGSFLKFTDVDNNPQVYHNTFEVGKTTGADRLIIAPASGQIDLICKLLETLPGPFGFLYILIVPRGGSQAGRYQLKDSLTLHEMSALLREYREFFEGDGRHTLYIASHSDETMLVYDRHNVIYVYGDLDSFMTRLLKLGYQKEPVRFPAPHVHHYHAEMDGEEKRLLSGSEWLMFPLEEQDDE